ncbi:MAG TPA: M56 family metallopeptidase [Gemmatimonadaceae bacterium]|nr:M56 family metallopeptidase [Gemmatimonadaceae bacterium]
MILSWMTYSIVVGALIVVAGVAFDHVAAEQQWPRRFLWAVAIVVAFAWPLAAAWRMLQPTPPSSILGFGVTLPTLRVGASAATSAASLPFILAITWLTTSALLFAKLTADILTLRRLRERWPVREIDGRRVRLTADVGPAVVGLRSMELVLPEWILSFDESLRALVFRHEEEHRSARDPHLLISARVAIALMPWNPALWFAARRLRHAIELDCDARVLHAHPSPARYGMLLLTIAQRRGTVPALAPMLSEPTTQLERRILAMQSSRRRFVRASTLTALFVAAGALALACSVQSDAPTVSASKTPPSPPPQPARSPFFEFQVERQATPKAGNPPRYPDALRRAKVEGTVVAQLVVNTDGTPAMSTFKVLRSTNPLFTNAVKESLASMKFNPAQVGGRAVRQLVQMPFVFSLSKRDSSSIPDRR